MGYTNKPIIGGVIMKILYAIFAIALVVVLVSGCAKAPTPNTTSGDNNPTPTNTGNPQTNTELKQCDEAIGYQVLIDALPTEVNGYIGDEPEGNMLTFANPQDQTQVWKYSTGRVNLVKDDKSIGVTATDTCYIQYLSLAWAGFYEIDGTDGYLKKTTVSGYPAWHEYSKPGNNYRYNVFVKDRVIVSIDGSRDVPDSDVTAAANAVGYSSIAAAAK